MLRRAQQPAEELEGFIHIAHTLSYRIPDWMKCKMDIVDHQIFNGTGQGGNFDFFTQNKGADLASIDSM